MARIPPDLLQKVKDTVNLIDVVGEHVVLKKSGSNYSGLCPFHSERSPSFSVSEIKQVYHCYGCKVGGDIVTFISQMHGLSFTDAVVELAERGKIVLPLGVLGGDGSPEQEKEREKNREKLALAHRLNRFVAAIFRKNLEGNLVPPASPYIESRGIGGDLQQNFYVGSVSAEWDSLAIKLHQGKAPLDLAVSLGLIRPSHKAPMPGKIGYFDLFRGRIMFPILDLRGKVAGFGGRTIPALEKLAGETVPPKYLNSPDSLLFHKSKLAFGLYQAQKHIREKDEVILVEGYFDVLGLHRAGFENAVATCGTTLSTDHIGIFKRLGAKITLLFDGDRAGQQAMDRAMVTALEQGQVVYGAFLPEGIDPDELVLKGPEGISQLGQILSHTKPLLDVRIEEALGETRGGGNEARVQAIRKVGLWLSRFRDPVGKEVRLESFCKNLGISRSLLEQTMRESESSQRQSGAPEPVRSPSQSKPHPSAPVQRKVRLTPNEKILIQAIVSWGDYSEFFSSVPSLLPAEMTFSDIFSHPSTKSWAMGLLDPGKIEEGLARLKEFPESLLEGVEDLQVRSIISEALVQQKNELAKEQVDKALKQRISLVWARFSQRLRQALSEAETKNDTGLHAQLMKDYLDVQKKMKEFNSFYDKA